MAHPPPVSGLRLVLEDVDLRPPGLSEDLGGDRRFCEAGAVGDGRPVVVDDDGTAIADRARLAEATVTAKVLGETRGPKIDIFKYKAKTGYRRRMGHRQTYTSIEVTDITLGKPAGKAAKKPAETAPADEED